MTKKEEIAREKARRLEVATEVLKTHYSHPLFKELQRMKHDPREVHAINDIQWKLKISRNVASRLFREVYKKNIEYILKNG
jgi:hypothetical protein